MTDFEVLKALLERGVRLSRRGTNDDETCTHYVLSAGQGDSCKSVQVARSQWDTPSAAYAMRLLLNELTKPIHVQSMKGAQ